MRLLDIIFATLSLLLFSVVLAPVVVVLRFTGERNIFYHQERVGRNGRTFSILKFATMLENSPNLLTGNLTIKDDPRVLPVGRFLRYSKINELPQLINIIKGDMGFVGYRPVTRDHWDLYPENSRNELQKHRPGLTGLGSLIFRNEEKLLVGTNNPQRYYVEVIAPQKAALEVWYSRNLNIYLWFLLIVLTAVIVLFPKANLKRFLPTEVTDLASVILEF